MSENELPANASVVPVRIEDEMRSSYLDYAMSVIIGRALPDVRDGLKPVHRRILFAMYEQGNTYNRAFKKSARIVGDVIGKYHPHGDSAVYDALVRMAQGFSMRAPLVDGQGNFGSVDGDPAAAMRYTEVRMTRVTSELLADIEKETVDYAPNYDGSEQEPVVLPTRFPNLLVNGSEGIAVGMATKIPPHNLGEVLAATILLIDHPDATLDDLMELLPGPDFPTAGYLYGLDGIRDAYEGGRGVIRIRARTDVEVDERTQKPSIIVTELPYQVNKARLLEKIAELVRDRAVEGITDLRDESDRRGMRMVIECRRDVNTQVLLNQLFRKTQLEVSFGINMLAIVAGQPRVLGLREVLTSFIDFRRDVVTRRCLHELRKAEDRMHILHGLKKALDMIDEVIRTIRASANVGEAREGLMALLEIDAVQAQAILDMRLQKLTSLEINKLIDEINQVQQEIDRLRRILSDENELLSVIRTELVEVRDAYADERRTEILPFSGELTIEDLIANEDEVVTITHAGYIKRTVIGEYRTQKRGGKGSKGIDTKDEDVVANVFVTTTHSSLLIFTTTGKCYRLKVHELPAGGRATRGRPIINLIPVTAEERVAAVLPFDDFAEDTYILSITRNGTVKKSPLVAYQNIHSGGLIGVSIPEGDELIDVRLCHPGDEIMLTTLDGQSIRFDQDDVRPTGRNTMGVRGVRLREGDHVVSVVVLSREILEEDAALEAEEGGDAGKATRRNTVLTITENGYGKRTHLPEYPLQGRGGLGVITMKTSDRNGQVAAARFVAPDDQLIVITNRGQTIRTPIADVSVLGRNTQGVRIINLDGSEKVVGVARFSEREEEELEGEGTEDLEGAEDGSAEDGSAEAAGNAEVGAEDGADASANAAPEGDPTGDER
ncbi:MAG: DNA gyrase subunit A [Deltaproteobacteria bacterium]|nr:MAG: DNA gyrase subunit A [Deltaproteobacteria bacterium]